MSKSDDLISRQDAIEAIERKAYRHTYLDQIISIIDSLPSAEPKTGKWDEFYCGRGVKND